MNLQRVNESTFIERGVQIDLLVLGLLETNCYILSDPKSKTAVVIDPAADGDLIWKHCTSKDLTIHHILLTHGHYDHIGGLEKLKSYTDAPVWIHSNDSEMLVNGDMNLSSLLGIEYSSLTADQFYDGSKIEFGNYQLSVFETPGHTSGSICFAGNGFIISGDTLFRNSIGRTDFPSSNGIQLINSIQEIIFELPDETAVYPGHGTQTQIGHEKKHNPFLNGTQSII